MIEQRFDVPFVARLALREKQIQQTYRPFIGVHKWFARRPGALFRALLLAEFVDEPLAGAYYQGHDLRGRVIGDPFMGGGTPVVEANRLGCDVVGADINPMAGWVVRQELADLDGARFEAAAQRVTEAVEAEIGALYETTCLHCGDPHAAVKYFLWVKTQACVRCGERQDLFSKYLLAKNQRHPAYVLVCPCCGVLNEVKKLGDVERTRCTSCAQLLRLDGPAHRRSFACGACGHANTYPVADRPPEHRLYALEYACSRCKPGHTGRFFKAPDATDLERLQEAERRLDDAPEDLIPDDPIPPGDETTRLHRWGYQRYRELFNPRQLLGLGTLAAHIRAVPEPDLRHALLTVFSDTLRYQNMVCRYDTYALKVLDVFSVHGFPVGLTQCESALLGTPKVGSGGFRHFVEKYARAKAYCRRPFEHTLGHSNRKVYTPGERIAAHFVEEPPDTQHRNGVRRRAYLHTGSADTLPLAPNSLDAVLTDPPYFANVQYAELMDFCYVWLRKHLAGEVPEFEASSTRAEHELTVNQTAGRGIAHYTAGLSSVFRAFTGALRPGGPFAFTYHHNQIEAYFPIAVALLDAGLVCTATLACPAEMGASIHISGTDSSVLDTIFVCRTTGRVPAAQFEPGEDSLRRLLQADVARLRQAALDVTRGDIRCLLFGHLSRLAVWQARTGWEPSRDPDEKLRRVAEAYQRVYPLDLLEPLVARICAAHNEPPIPLPLFAAREPANPYEAEGALSF